MTNHSSGSLSTGERVRVRSSRRKQFRTTNVPACKAPSPPPSPQGEGAGARPAEGPIAPFIVPDPSLFTPDRHRGKWICIKNLRWRNSRRRNAHPHEKDGQDDGDGP